MNRVRVIALVMVTGSLMLVNLPMDGVTQDDKPTSQKVIKDQTEFNAYMSALNETDAAKRAAMMESFVEQYPQSIVKFDALEQAMGAYQKAKNTAKVEQTAKRILELKPNHVRALAIVVALDREKATLGDQAALKEDCSYAPTGSEQLASWEKPEGMKDDEFEELRHQMSAIFSGAAGFCALQAKDYSAARDGLTKAVQLDPNSLQDLYQLAVADLEMNPIDLNGLWYCGKAINLEQGLNNPDGVKSMMGYCKAKYKKYHGGEDGWGQFMASVPAQNAPPPADVLAKAIPKAPTPCELAVKAVHENKLEDMPFADYEFILQFRDCSPANKEAADQVWAYIQALQKNGEARIKMPSVKVIAATKETMDAALTDDNQTNGKADLHVVFEKPVLRPPAKGAKTDITGLLKDYTPNPFVFTMEQGVLPPVKKVVRKPTAKGRTSTRRKST
jgi:hypothetical protein